MSTHKCVWLFVRLFLLWFFSRCCWCKNTIHLSFFRRKKVQKSFICVCKPFAIHADLSKRNSEKSSPFTLAKPFIKTFFRCVLTPIFPFQREKKLCTLKRGTRATFFLFFSAVVLLAVFVSVLLLLPLSLLLLSFQNALCVYLPFGWAYVLYIWYNRAGRRKRFGLQNNPIAERWRSCFSFIVCSFYSHQPKLDNTDMANVIERL